MIGFGKVFEFRRFRIKTKLDSADRAVPLFGDNNLAKAVRGVKFLVPFLILVICLFITVVRTWRLPSSQVIFFPEDEHDDVGILLDRPRFAQVSKHRSLILAL